ncbi:MAG: zeta toxin family protein [Nitrococcus sp.]|nr:zeta toxin family protein [Nitrococcus sp.]
MTGRRSHPTCWIIAGPNGAGKTTFALSYLPEVVGCRRFINVDSIAAGLSPLSPEQVQVAASRIYLSRIKQCVRERQDFGFETTLSGRAYFQLVSRLQCDGWRVELVYLALPSVEMSRLRVAERVAHGGHDIPQAAIERRFARSLRNFFCHFASQVDRSRCFLNNGDVPLPVLVQQGENRTILDVAVYADLQSEARL